MHAFARTEVAPLDQQDTLMDNALNSPDAPQPGGAPGLFLAEGACGAVRRPT